MAVSYTLHGHKRYRLLVRAVLGANRIPCHPAVHQNPAQCANAPSKPRKIGPVQIDPGETEGRPSRLRSRRACDAGMHVDQSLNRQWAMLGGNMEQRDMPTAFYHASHAGGSRNTWQTVVLKMLKVCQVFFDHLAVVPCSSVQIDRLPMVRCLAIHT